MATSSSLRTMLSGTGNFTGPSLNTQFEMVIKFLKLHLNTFIKLIQYDNIVNENGLNSRLSRFITNAAAQELFFAEREKMEDETKGDSPSVDIGIFLKVDDIEIDPPLITVLEGKRLTEKMRSDRRKEYVIGHKKNGKTVNCGGIERFKLGLHGRLFSHAGMIGYLQDGTPDMWHIKITEWICDLCKESDESVWADDENLIKQTSNGKITEYHSLVRRKDDLLHLTHLWLDVTFENIL